MNDYQLLVGDCIESMRDMPDQSVNCCVTSPPYFGLRDYGMDGQIGLEQRAPEYVRNLVSVFSEVHRVLRDDGVLFVNLG
ncbi:MAG TPA: DNA methyltransferase, partial [Devosia sp.]